MAPRRAWLLAALALPGLGCLGTRLSVDVLTRIHPDGTCDRRIEYRFEKQPAAEGASATPTGAPPPPTDEARARHRFPAGPTWSVHEESAADADIVVAEALLASPEQIDWDYWRAHAPQAPPARNYVSFERSEEEGAGVFQYLETFSDPNSPLAFMRLLADVMQRGDDEFARGFGRALGQGRARSANVKRAFRERVAMPLSRDLEALTRRPLSGRWQRLRLHDLMDRIERLEQPLLDALCALVPEASRPDVEQAANAAFEALSKRLEQRAAAAGLDPATWMLADDQIHFRVTVVMPGPIARANTCFEGDTATWEFDQDDLYGGFEMWARAETR